MIPLIHGKKITYPKHLAQLFFMPILGPVTMLGAYLGSRRLKRCGLRRSSEWVAGDSYNLQNDRGTTFVFTEIEGVLQVV